MNVEAANDVDPKYYPGYIISIQVCVGDVWVGIVWACVLIFMCLRGQIHAAECCYEDVGSCGGSNSHEVRFSTSLQPNKTCMCVYLCVCVYVCLCVCH